MQIRFLGIYNGQSKQTNLITLLIDGIIAVESGSLVSGLSLHEQQMVKAILVSHCHYDHILALPMFAFNTSSRGDRLPADVYATKKTIGVIKSHFFDGIIYPKFTDGDSYLGRPALETHTVTPYKAEKISGYRVVPYPMKHTVECAGFEITAPDGKGIFYTGDTGPGLAHIWERISPELIVADATFPNRLITTARDSGHLCPETLFSELSEFKRIKGYVPRIVLSHVCPEHEAEIREEAARAAAGMGVTVENVSDGTVLEI